MVTAVPMWTAGLSGAQPAVHLQSCAMACKAWPCGKPGALPKPCRAGCWDLNSSNLNFKPHTLNTSTALQHLKQAGDAERDARTLSEDRIHVHGPCTAAWRAWAPVALGFGVQGLGFRPRALHA